MLQLQSKIDINNTNFTHNENLNIKIPKIVKNF